MDSQSKSILVTKAVKIYPLIIPILLVLFVYQEGWDWKAFFITFAITYFLWPPGITFAQYYEDSMVVFQPFIFKKKIISYEQIEHIKEVTVGQTFPSYSPFDLYVYVKDKKTTDRDSHAIIGTKQTKIQKTYRVKRHSCQLGHFRIRFLKTL